LWEQDHVADAFLAEEHHAQAVYAQAHAAGGGHAVFEGDQKIFIELLLLAARLVLEALALFERVVLLRVGRGNFLAVDATFENLDRRGVLRRELGQRTSSLGKWVTKVGWINVGSISFSNTAPVTSKSSGGFGYSSNALLSLSFRSSVSTGLRCRDPQQS